MASTSIDRISGLSTSEALKSPCKVAAVENITLYGEQVVQGVACVAGERVLVTAQTNGADNGIYIVSASTWTRAKDWNGARDIVQYTQVFAGAGDSYSEGVWRITTANPITVGTTSIAFEKDTSLSSVSVSNVDGIAAVAVTNSYNDLDDLPDIVGTGDMLASVYDPALKEEQVITISDIGVLAALDSVGTTEIDDGSVTYAKMQNVSPNKVLGSAAGGAVSELSATASGLAIMAAADAAAQRALLSLGTMATQSASAVAITGGSITGLSLPTNLSDAATKQYVDGIAAGSLHTLEAVKCATTVAGTLATDYDNGSVVDGYTLATNDRILIKNLASGQYNGIYIVQSSGAPVRATDANTSGELVGALIPVLNGTVNGNTVWALTNTSVTVDTTVLVFTNFNSSLTREQVGKLAAVVIWTPSDRTGASDMTSELQTFVAANQGYLVKVAENSTIRLANAFTSDTTNSIRIDFGHTKIIQPNTATAALKLNNPLGSSIDVNTLALEVYSGTSRYSTATLVSSSGGQRFDYYLIHSTTANPAKDGGYLGEICQIVRDESGSKLVFARKLNKHDHYSSGLQVCKMDATRKVYIRGGIWSADGDSENIAITTRGDCIQVIGFVKPELYDITVTNPWRAGIRLQCTADARVDNLSYFNVGNLAYSNGFTYGVSIYAANDGAYLTRIFTRNGRHPAVTTDGNDGSTSLANARGIPTNIVINGVFSMNSFGSPVDTHEEGDNIVIKNVVAMFGANDDYALTNGDGSLNPDPKERSGFNGLAIQVRCSRVTIDGCYFYGSYGGIKIENVPHNGGDTTTIINTHFKNMIGSTGNARAIDVISAADDASARKVILNNVTFDGTDICIVLGARNKLSYSNVHAVNFNTFMLQYPSSEAVMFHGLSLDYADSTYTAPYYGIRSYTVGGSPSITAFNTHIMMEAPRIRKGNADNKPAALFRQEANNSVARNYFCPAIVEYNPSGVAATTITDSGTTFTLVPVTGVAAQALNATSNLSDVANITTAFNNISPLTTKGDVLIHGASGNERLPVGTDGQVPIADSSVPAGIRWGSPTGGAAVTSFYDLSEVASAAVGAGFNRTFTLASSDRISFVQNTTTVTGQPSSFEVLRTASYTGANATASWLNYGIYARTTVSSSSNTTEIALGGQVDNYAVSGTYAKNTGVYALGNNYAAGTTWGLKASVRDVSGSLVTPVSLIGAEVGIYANKTHTNSNFIGMNVVGGKAITGSTPKFYAGILVDSQDNSNANATWTNGLLIGDYTARGVGVALACDTGVRIHTTKVGGAGVLDTGSKAVGFYADGTYTGAAFKMSQGQKVSWTDDDTVQTYYDGSEVSFNKGIRITDVRSSGTFFRAITTGSGTIPAIGVDFGAIEFETTGGAAGFILRSCALDVKNDGRLVFKKATSFSSTAGAAAAKYLQVTDELGTTYKIPLLANA